MQSSDFSPDDLQGFLRDAWNNAPQTANSLSDQLKAEEASKIAWLKGGMVMSVSKNGVSQTYSLSSRSFTIEKVTRIYSTLIRHVTLVYNEMLCQANNVQANVNGFDFDQLIFDWLICKYDELAMGTTRPDLTNLSLPGCGRVTQPEGVWAW